MPTWRIADASPSAVSACVSCVHEEAHRTEYRRTLHAGRALHPEWPRWVWSNRETSRADKCARALVALSPSSTVYTLEYSTYRVSNEPRWLKRDVVLHGQAEGVRRRRIPSCRSDAKRTPGRCSIYYHVARSLLAGRCIGVATSPLTYGPHLSANGATSVPPTAV